MESEASVAKCESESQLAEMYDGSPKVRKPYTITKQREKWTEDEHQKFLEALKLYGRGWRQIEEHVGTKTAVQIRSHAQKFFSKVVRGTTESVEGCAKPIDIPPPRPKRKPVHPYPRKPSDSVSVTPATNQTERSSSPNTSAADKETKSPTSVLSIRGSDSRSAASNHHNRSPSATSCSTDIHSISQSPSEKENNNFISYIEEKQPLTAKKLSSASTVEHLSPTRFEVGNMEASCPKEPKLSASGSFKLFGRTVLLSESQKQSPPSVEDNQITDPGLALSSGQLDTKLTLGVVKNFNPPANGSLVKPEKPFLLWSLYQAPFQHIESYNQTLDQYSPNSCTEENLGDKERSCTGSNEFLTSGDKNSEAVDSISQPLKSGVVEPCSSRKGFVPYKRCLAERENMSSIVSNDRERQKIRVC